MQPQVLKDATHIYGVQPAASNINTGLNYTSLTFLNVADDSVKRVIEHCHDTVFGVSGPWKIMSFEKIRLSLANHRFNKSV